MLDVGITATLRPTILQATLESFRDNLFKDAPLRIILNVDPVGEDINPAKVVELAGRYCDKIEYRIAPAPHFPTAFKWVWSHFQSEFVFSLEDDWQLLYPMDLSDMLQTMWDIPKLAVLRLSAFPAGQDRLKCWNKFFPWSSDGFFECPEDIRHRVGFCGHPSLMRSEWALRIWEYLDWDRNPEKQIQLCRVGSRMFWELTGWRYGVWATQGSPSAIKDLGREWIAKTGWEKGGGNKAWFTHWIPQGGVTNA
jgi:hypothetical protein